MDYDDDRPTEWELGDSESPELEAWRAAVDGPLAAYFGPRRGRALGLAAVLSVGGATPVAGGVMANYSTGATRAGGLAGGSLSYQVSLRLALLVAAGAALELPFIDTILRAVQRLAAAGRLEQVLAIAALLDEQAAEAGDGPADPDTILN